jgi:hypothetical protein
MAAESTSRDVAAKERIMKHMNADHQKTLSYYLRNYHHLSTAAASSATMQDITLSSITLLASAKTYTVPIFPPLKSLGEARTRLIEMDIQSRTALNISCIEITEYIPPQSIFHRTIFGLCVFTMVVFATRAWIVPETFFYDKVLPWFPGGAEWFLWAVRMVFWPTIVLHTVEATMLDMTRLRKYGVDRGSGLWWKWMASAFMEGFGSFMRIDKAVKTKEIEAEKVKH